MWRVNKVFVNTVKIAVSAIKMAITIFLIFCPLYVTSFITQGSTSVILFSFIEYKLYSHYIYIYSSISRIFSIVSSQERIKTQPRITLYRHFNIIGCVFVVEQRIYEWDACLIYVFLGYIIYSSSNLCWQPLWVQLYWKSVADKIVILIPILSPWFKECDLYFP